MRNHPQFNIASAYRFDALEIALGRSRLTVSALLKALPNKASFRRGEAMISQFAQQSTTVKRVSGLAVNLER